MDDDQERVDLWLRLQPNVEFSVHLWRNELERAAALIESVRPLVEASAADEVVACFYVALALLHVRERRYRVDAQILEEHRRAADCRSGAGTGHLIRGPTSGRGAAHCATSVWR